ESACTDTPLTFKRKGHFNIGLYAKRRKLFLQELVDEKITADVKVKSLQNKLNYRKRKEMKEMEGKVYEVQGDSVTFECKLIPSDQKWMASMAGELNNAATYFSSFANVSKSNVKTIGGTIGDDSSCTWKKWRYEQRMKDVDEVKAFKARNKIPENSKSSNHRGKVTAHIASRKSRQEFSPPLGKYVDNFKPEPLHNSNNAWQHWNLDILTTAMKLTDRAVINKANGDITQLPSITPMAKYMSLLKYKMKAGRLYKNVERWFREKKKAEDFQYRFTDMGIEL
ncbi:hypothetical protein QZH41_017572, partial [Actinostola sp. cb2023]